MILDWILWWKPSAGHRSASGRLNLSVFIFSEEPSAFQATLISDQLSGSKCLQGGAAEALKPDPGTVTALELNRLHLTWIPSCVFYTVSVKQGGRSRRLPAHSAVPLQKGGTVGDQEVMEVAVLLLSKCLFSVSDLLPKKPFFRHIWQIFAKLYEAHHTLTHFFDERVRNIRNHLSHFLVCCQFRHWPGLLVTSSLIPAYSENAVMFKHKN